MKIIEGARPSRQNLFYFLATCADAPDSDLEKLHFLTFGQRANLDCPYQIAFDIFNPAAFAADEMMMMLRVRIESDAARFEEFLNHPFLFQPVERVVNGRARSHREFAVDHLQYFVGRWMMMRRLHEIYNRAPLRRHLKSARLRHRLYYLSVQSRHRCLD